MLSWRAITTWNKCVKGILDFGKSINIFEIKECTGNCLKWKLGALLSRLPKEKQRKQEIKEEMDRLDHIICSNINSDITSGDEELKQYDNLKKELQ